MCHKATKPNTLDTYPRKIMPKVLRKPVKLALIQLATTADKARNLERARSRVLEAVREHRPKIVVLPECFNSPYGTKYFRGYAEVLRGQRRAHNAGPESESEAKSESESGTKSKSSSESPTFDALSRLARETRTYLVGGSIPELDPATQKIYNTSLTFGPSGALLATHRKVHLFDIDIPGKIRFKESEVLSPGNNITVVDMVSESDDDDDDDDDDDGSVNNKDGNNAGTESMKSKKRSIGKFAIAICYDIRFPELAMVAARKHNAFLLLYPGAFNMTTGPLHWELQARARAMDNQCFVGVCSPARAVDAEYQAWGHSMIVGPDAKVMAEADEKEATVVAELKPEAIEEVRRGIPIYDQRRFDIYADVATAEPTGVSTVSD